MQPTEASYPPLSHFFNQTTLYRDELQFVICQHNYWCDWIVDPFCLWLLYTSTKFNHHCTSQEPCPWRLIKSNPKLRRAATKKTKKNTSETSQKPHNWFCFFCDSTPIWPWNHDKGGIILQLSILGIDHRWFRRLKKLLRWWAVSGKQNANHKGIA